MMLSIFKLQSNHITQWYMHIYFSGSLWIWRIWKEDELVWWKRRRSLWAMEEWSWLWDMLSGTYFSS